MPCSARLSENMLYLRKFNGVITGDEKSLRNEYVSSVTTTKAVVAAVSKGASMVRILFDHVGPVERKHCHKSGTVKTKYVTRVKIPRTHSTANTCRFKLEN